MEDFNKVVKELEKIRKEQAEEAKEIAFLKWSNACMRHELMRQHEQQREEHVKNKSPQLVLELGLEITSYDSESEHMGSEHKGSRRQRLLQRLRRLVE